jgi:hypothetical protein
VVEYADVHQLQCFAQPACHQLIGLARLGDTGGMLGCISRCHHHLFLSVSSPTVPQTFSSPAFR